MLKALLFLALLAPAMAGAHVKWFAKSWHEEAAPIGIGGLLGSPAFLALFALTCIVAAGCQSMDARLSARRSVLRLLRQAELTIAEWVPRVLRVGLAAYFSSIALYFSSSPILLTPELKTGIGWMPTVQLAIAAGLLWRPAVIPACALIVALYGYAAHVYGWVHVLDYHFFLGVVALLALDARAGPRVAQLGLFILRVTVATSFMWVAVEKWLYPTWTHEILMNLLPPVLSGFDVHFSCTAAGFVEFALAFFILFGVMASQVAALLLLSLLLAAIPFVGAVDAIGHLPLVVSLGVLASTRNRWVRTASARQFLARVGVSLFPATLAALLVLYFFSHEWALVSRMFDPWPADLSHAASAGLVGYGLMRALHGLLAARRARPIDR